MRKVAGFMVGAVLSALVVSDVAFAAPSQRICDATEEVTTCRPSTPTPVVDLTKMRQGFRDLGREFYVQVCSVLPASPPNGRASVVPIPWTCLPSTNQRGNDRKP